MRLPITSVDLGVPGIAAGYTQRYWGNLEFALNRTMIAHQQIFMYKHAHCHVAWLYQTHSTNIRPFNQANHAKADGVYSNQIHQLCLVRTADCVPLLITDTQGQYVMAVHAGWRGILQGIIQHAISLFPSNHSVVIWVGPHICQSHFAIHHPIANEFMQKDLRYQAALQPFNESQYGLSLKHVLEIIFNDFSQIDRVLYQGDCTYANSDKWFSYRRDGKKACFASFIYKF